MKQALCFAIDELQRIVSTGLGFLVEVYKVGYWKGYKDALTKEVLE